MSAQPYPTIERPGAPTEECQHCFDLGILSVRSLHDGVESLMRCNCAQGRLQIDDFPRWAYQWGKLYERKRCPIEWFKPKSEGPIFLKGEFNKEITRKMNDWKARREIALMYWKHLEANVV